MSSSPQPVRWRFLVSPRWLAWHGFAVACTVGMFWLGAWQLHRAESGNTLSWAYTFEWPIFAVFVVVFWAKTVLDEWRHPGGTAHKRERAAAAVPDDEDVPFSLPEWARAAAADSDGAEDPELAAYNAYLASLNAPKRRTRSRPVSADD